ncbi:MAG: molybdopterin-dependent oxidoreductase [Streptosporangiales bacterium]|nr:molybdopterin-dependent oxidoreductase [Streptosporangiales bacterium]
MDFTSRRSVVGAFNGFATLAAGLGVALLAAAVVRPSAFPLLAVADSVVDMTPEPVKQWAIRTFGESDKLVLIIGVIVVLTAASLALGRLALGRLTVARWAVTVIGALGVAAAVTRPDSAYTDALPTLIGIVAALGALTLLTRRAELLLKAASARQEAEPADAGDTASADAEEAGAAEGAGARSARVETVDRDRRRLLVAGAGTLGVAAVAGGVGGALFRTLNVDPASAAAALPRPARPAAPLPRGVDLPIPGLSPFTTPADDFYRVDTALIVPRISPEDWTLRIHGMVEREVELTYADLLKLPMFEHDTTLACVSNEVGGDLVGNARWLGASLADVLRMARPRAGADQILSRSSDGMTIGTPVQTVLDGRDAQLAVAMNGAPLPLGHGFPVRMVVPGLYGYVSATKWVTELKLTRYADERAYWVDRGWADRAEIKTASRIDVPRSGARLRPGRVTVAGVAWAQHRGVDAVEVRADDGAWEEARLAQVPGIDTWRQWAYDWQATPGTHRLQVRATDGEGRTQTGEETPIAPDGSTGWHTLTVTVR